ncbi:MAG TPA: hypothetical protein VLB09_05785, partial [Nitrospiria bacterium]|nr:hypothetical protein [Nitrospiria bacterium]
VTGHKDPTPEEMEEALSKAKEDWVEARDRDEAIGIFLKAAAVAMDRGVFFVVKGPVVSVWTGFPEAVDEALKGVEIKLSEAPAIKGVIEGKNTYKGIGPASEGVFQDFYKGLGTAEAPKEVIICPVLINEQVISVFFGDNQPSGRSIKAQGYLGTLSRKLCMSLEVLILKKKIMEM